MRLGFVVLFTLAGAAVASSPRGALGQADSANTPTGRFLGHIVSTTDSIPVRTADIRLLYLDSVRTVRAAGGDSLELFIDSTRTRLAVSDSTGGFIIRRLREGRYLLQIRRIGFAPLEGVVIADTGAVGDVFSMQPTSQLLAKVVITETSVDRVKQRLDRVGFIDRSHTGESGTFVQRADVLRLKRDRLEDLLASYGIHSGDVVLDRMPLDYDDVRDYPTDLVVGVEIYRRGRPTEFNMTRRGPNLLSAGGQSFQARPLVIVWTFVPGSS